MRQYEEVYRSLGLPPSLIGLARGEIKIPSPTEEQPARVYGFPPALVPLWSRSSPLYFGIWKHWWVKRSLSFIKMYVELNHLVHEIARNTDQLTRLLIIDQIVFQDGVTPEIEGFASELGVEGLDALDAVTLETGDAPAGFLVLPVFAQDPPAECEPDAAIYKGEFPLRGSSLSSVQLDRMCTFELPPELLRSAGPDAPPWILPGDRRPLFDRFLSAGDLGAAWLTLNSRGWSYIDAKKAIADLARAADDPAFSVLADAWSSLPTEHLGGY